MKRALIFFAPFVLVLVAARGVFGGAADEGIGDSQRRSDRTGRQACAPR